MKPLRRTLHPETRVLDAKTGLVEYIASDETVDSYREVIRADGWRFNNFKKNAPFVDSHNYDSIDRLLGQVIDFRVVGRKLMEVVQWAKDIPEQPLAALGWKLTQAGFLKAVSVGFIPLRAISRWDGMLAEGAAEWNEQLSDLGLTNEANVRTIYLEQEQLELSAVIIGANPNALAMTARAYKDAVLTDADLETLSRYVTRETAAGAARPDEAPAARHRAQVAFLDKLQTTIKST